jgi:hypothetical protein
MSSWIDSAPEHRSLNRTFIAYLGIEFVLLVALSILLTADPFYAHRVAGVQAGAVMGVVLALVWAAIQLALQKAQPRPAMRLYVPYVIPAIMVFYWLLVIFID